MASSTLAVVRSGYVHLNALCERIAARAVEAGHQPRFFESDAALRADPGAWGDLDVLLCTGTFPMDEAFLSSAKRLRGAMSVITGMEGFDLPLASRHGVAISNGQVPENSLSVAEATVLMLLSVFYDINGAQKLLAGNLPRPLQLHTRMLYRRKIGFIGFGVIAREVARRLSTWNVDMMYHTRRAKPEPEAFARPVDLRELLSTSDAVVILAPLNQDSRHLLNDERLGWMKPGSILVNMARGGICDEDALYRHLRSGHLAAAALDTFEVEPLPMSSPLRDLPNVVLTPHIIGHTADSHEAIDERAMSNALRMLEGQLPEPLLNPESLPNARFDWRR